MAKRVVFSYHAAQRMSERLNIRVDYNREVDISANFKLVKTYKHEVHQNMVEAWISKDRSNPVCLIVSQVSSVVLTVLLGSKLAGRSAPFVDSLYSV